MELARSDSCRNVARVTVHEKSSTRRTAFTAMFVLLYAIVLPWAWSTMGEPLRRAQEESSALSQKRELEEFEAFDEGVVSWGDDEGDDNPDESDFDDGDWEIDDDDFENDEVNEESKSTKKNETEDVEDEEVSRPLPSAYLPDAGATASLFLLLCAHALFHLLQHWLVWFEVKSFYTPSKKIVAGSFLHIEAHAHRGKPAIVEIKKNSRSSQLEFEFQRQKFVVKGSNTGGLEKEGEGVQLMTGEESLLEPEVLKEKKEEAMKISKEKGFIMPMRASSSSPLEHYLKTRGLENDRMIQEAQDRFGENSLQVKSDTIPQLIQKQLMTPLAIFQLFSASLWLMDEYWQQTIFSIITIIMMESTTAFQRHRTLKTLRNLAPKPFHVPCFRKGKWTSVLTSDLLPGDIVSLSSLKTNSISKEEKMKPKNIGTDVVPCDCLILHGSAVVNEATLTGESVPQMKDALNPNSGLQSNLEMQGRDRVHVLFSGTTIVSATPGAKSSDAMKDSPNNGCICYVLRTGFGSSQGELMQMIEFSTDQVTSDAKETGVALLILLVFALCSSAYVFKTGMERGDRTTHELLLKCVIIITSVVPQTLPVQMAAAVNFAMMALMKQGIFCTEPFRLPYSGRVTHVLFDKTGTLTSDELVPVGVINREERQDAVEAHKALVDVVKSSSKTSMILAACHSLIASPVKGKDGEKSGELLGDPIELAAMKGIKWRYDPSSQTASPGDSTRIEQAIKVLKLKIEAKKKSNESKLQNKQNKDTDELNKMIEQLKSLEISLNESQSLASKSAVQGIRILNRYHFASKLQRMSVIAKIKMRGAAAFRDAPVCLVKGSPEAIKTLLVENDEPSWYTSTYRGLAEKGMRVLALAYKDFDANVSINNMSREQAESDLKFVGFIAFRCKTRADTPMVIRSLRNAAHSVAMLTGDAPLTALHVAKETGICGDKDRAKNPPLILTAHRVNENESRDEELNSPALLEEEHIIEQVKNYKFEWVGAVGNEKDAIRIPFDHTIEGCGLSTLYEKHDLLTTEHDLLLAEAKSQGKIWSGIENIKVFARMSPQGKAKVIRKLQDDKLANVKRYVFMCGDGGNDVGALKQADVGLALLSGYGSANTVDSETTETIEDQDAEAALNARAETEAKRARKAMKEKKKEFAARKKIIMAKQQGLLEAELNRRQLAGEPGGVTGHFQAMKKVTLLLKQELTKENEALNRKYNIHLKASNKKPKNAFEAAEAAMEQLEDDPSAMPIVRPGDASVAAPFTSRIPSVRSAVHMIRQGRCTLLSALQQQQIMMLECTIRAYCLAALSVEGARSSERQLIASSWLIMMAVGAFSYSSPVDEMHPVRPLRSLFHPAVFISIMLQAAIHLFCIVYAVELAREAMGPEKLKEVIEFNRRLDRESLKQQEVAEEDYNPMEELLALWSTPFKPNLLNTVVFLVETAQTMAVFFVNYKGRPWMKGIIENHALFLSLFVTIGAVAACAWELVPKFNRLIHLEPFPDDFFRWQVMGLVLASIVGTFIVDRLVTAVFAPKVFSAMLESGMKTRPSDLMPILTTLVKVILGFGLVGTGNPIIWMGAYWLYKKRKSMIEEAEEAALD